MKYIFEGMILQNRAKKKKKKKVGNAESQAWHVL